MRRTAKRTSRRRDAALVAFAATLLVGATARADEPPTLRYETPQEAHHLRAVGEELVVLAAGFGEYVLDKSNSRDFDLGYDWPSLRSKLLFRSLAFDNNLFATNFATHPLGGYFYYGVARGNRLTIPESFLYAVLASTAWEFIGEWREQASINDLVYTPVSGVPIGEAFFHLGAFFQRSRPTVATTAASWLFGAPKDLNDIFDDARPAPPDAYDDLGLPADTFHRFHVRTGAGVTFQDRAPVGVDARASLSSRIVAIPGWAGEGRRSGWFGQGEVSELLVSLTGSPRGLADFVVAADVMPFGFYDQDVSAGWGQTTIVGLDLGFDYTMHDFDRDRRRGLDRGSLVSGGIAFEHRLRADRFTMRAQLDVLADFGGMDAYALPDYVRVHGTDGLQSVQAEQAYSFVFGTTMRPRLELAWAPFDVGGDLRADWLGGVRGLDRVAETGDEVRVSDRRVALRTYAGFAATKHLALEVSVERRLREGQISEISASRAETSLFASADVRF